MNPTKTNHATAKARRIKNDLVDTIRKRLSEAERVLDDAGIRQALEDHRFEVRDASCKHNNGYGGIRSYVIFDAERGNEARQAEAEAKIKDIEVAYSTLVDELVLGDEAEALRLLRNFAALSSTV